MNTQRRLFFSQLAAIVAGIVSAAFLRFVPKPSPSRHPVGIKLTPLDDQPQYFLPSDYSLKPSVVSNPGSEQLELMWGVKSEYPENREKPFFMSNVGDQEDWDYKPTRLFVGDIGDH